MRRHADDARPRKTPAAHAIDIDAEGNTVGLFCRFPPLRPAERIPAARIPASAGHTTGSVASGASIAVNGLVPTVRGRRLRSGRAGRPPRRRADPPRGRRLDADRGDPPAAGDGRAPRGGHPDRPVGRDLVENPVDGLGAQLVFTLGVSLILFHGGLGISLASSRAAVGLGLLVLPGILITALVVALVAMPVFSLSFSVALSSARRSRRPTRRSSSRSSTGSLRPKVAQTVIASPRRRPTPRCSPHGRGRRRGGDVGATEPLRTSPRASPSGGARGSAAASSSRSCSRRGAVGIWRESPGDGDPRGRRADLLHDGRARRLRLPRGLRHGAHRREHGASRPRAPRGPPPAARVVHEQTAEIAVLAVFVRSG